MSRIGGSPSWPAAVSMRVISAMRPTMPWILSAAASTFWRVPCSGESGPTRSMSICTRAETMASG